MKIEAGKYYRTRCGLIAEAINNGNYALLNYPPKPSQEAIDAGQQLEDTFGDGPDKGVEWLYEGTAFYSDPTNGGLTMVATCNRAGFRSDVEEKMSLDCAVGFVVEVAFDAILGENSGNHLVPTMDGSPMPVSELKKALKNILCSNDRLAAHVTGREPECPETPPWN